MDFRRATLHDVDALTILRIGMLREEEDYSDSFLNLLMNNTKQYVESGLADTSYSAWLAEVDGAAIAMGGITYFSLPPNDWCPNGKTAYIGGVYTLPSYRKQGIATKLMNLLISEAKVQKCQRILLNSSDMGKSIYEKMGFIDSPSAMALYPFGLMSQV